MRLLASLTNRIFLASSLLAVISIAAAVTVVNVRVTRDAEASLQRDLQDSAGLVAEWQASLSQSFLLAARLIADTPHLKAAVDTGDPDTVRPLAERYCQRIDADVFVVTDRVGRALSVTGEWQTADVPPSAVSQALAGEESVSYRPHPAGLLEIVTVPIALEPQVIGSLSVGFLFDRKRAGQLKRASETEIAFAIDGRVVAATISTGDFDAVTRLLRSPATTRLTLRGNEYLGLVHALSAAGDAGPAGPHVLVLQSRSARLRALGEIHEALAVTAIVAVLVAVLLSYMVARTVTRPLGVITAGMREISVTGDLTRKITLSSGHWDEDARLLATTFNRLTESVARFQRDAAQKERLSSLGRLSTVIAHEIRNPLMIIKAAVRTLRRETTNEGEVRQAAVDIGEEVDRLNRIVTEVLDFARPIRFAYADADLAALCSQSAAAAAAGESYPEVRVAGDRPLPVVTDVERLRGVLVNLVANARQAVLARGQSDVGGPADPAGRADVEVRAGALGPDRVVIEVEDRGVGIPADVMPHVFEPYFSTRREGTGIGLAIARNVIDGLEGTITLAGGSDGGTRVRIELPRVPAGRAQGASTATPDARP